MGCSHTHAHTHSLTHSLTHPLTHSLTLLYTSDQQLQCTSSPLVAHSLTWAALMPLVSVSCNLAIGTLNCHVKTPVVPTPPGVTHGHVPSIVWYTCRVDWSPLLEHYPATAAVSSALGQLLFKGLSAKVDALCCCAPSAYPLHLHYELDTFNGDSHKPSSCTGLRHLLHARTTGVVDKMQESCKGCLAQLRE